jgi:hypothetical protein
VWIKASFVGAFVCFGAVQVEAAPRAAREPAEASAARGGRFTALGREAPCFRFRKKLWVDGRGWVVRRVASCR